MDLLLWTGGVAGAFLIFRAGVSYGAHRAYRDLFRRKLDDLN